MHRIKKDKLRAINVFLMSACRYGMLMLDTMEQSNTIQEFHDNGPMFPVYLWLGGLQG